MGKKGILLRAEEEGEMGEKFDQVAIMFLMTRERAEKRYTFTEFRETFFPNITDEELFGEPTEEQIQEDLKRIVEIARRNTARADSQRKHK